MRSYLVTEPSPSVLKKTDSHQRILMLSSLLLIAFYVRMYNLSNPNSVVFDEVHFGGFARKYILGTFFMDVHPPLAKMLLELLEPLVDSKVILNLNQLVINFLILHLIYL